MRTGGHDRDGNQRRGWRAVLVAAAAGAAIWSTAQTSSATAPGSPSCVAGRDATAIDYATGRVCPPEGFVAALGYEPVLVHTAYGWRNAKPEEAGAECSGPLPDTGPTWDFTVPCATHDYGYDLVRFGMGSRRAADTLFYADMRASCRERSVFDRPLCDALARYGKTGLDVGDLAGYDVERLSTGPSGVRPADRSPGPSRTSAIGGAMILPTRPRPGSSFRWIRGDRAPRRAPCGSRSASARSACAAGASRGCSRRGSARSSR